MECLRPHSTSELDLDRRGLYSQTRAPCCRNQDMNGGRGTPVRPRGLKGETSHIAGTTASSVCLNLYKNKTSRWLRGHSQVRRQF